MYVYAGCCKRERTIKRVWTSVRRRTRLGKQERQESGERCILHLSVCTIVRQRCDDGFSFFARGEAGYGVIEERESVRVERSEFGF